MIFKKNLSLTILDDFLSFEWKKDLISNWNSSVLLKYKIYGSWISWEEQLPVSDISPDMADSLTGLHQIGERNGNAK